MDRSGGGESRSQSERPIRVLVRPYWCAYNDEAQVVPLIPLMPQQEEAFRSAAPARLSDIGDYMADPTFLNHLETLRTNYIFTPRNTPITPVAIKSITHDLQEIGRLVQDVEAHRHHKLVTRLLMSISSRCLDMLQVDDYDALFKGIALLRTNKNAGYAGVGTTDPWKNFRMAQWFGVSPFVGCLIRMSDKAIRIKNLSENPAADMVGESIRDTLHDLAVYCLIAVCLWDEEQSVILCDGGMIQ